VAIRARRDPRVRRDRRRDRDGPEAHVTLNRRALRFGLAASLATVILAAVVVVPARTARAHAELLSSDPPAGAQLEVAPAAVTLQFNESVTFVAGSIRLIDASGTTLDGVGVPIHPGGGATASATLPALVEGGYVVAWNVVSADGHPASGAFTFVVGTGSAPDASVVAGATAGGGNGSAGVLLKVLRALGYVGLMVALGLWAFVLLVDRLATADRILQGLVAGGGALVVVSSLARIPAQSAYTGLGWHTVVDQDIGTAWIALAAVGAVLALAPLDWARVAPSAQGVVLAALAVGAGVAVAYGGHGAVGRAHLLGLAATVVHVVAASVWVGGLVGLARRWSAGPVERRWVVAARFSTIAMFAAVVVVASGVAQSLRQLDRWSEVTGTDFGTTLIVKVGLVVVLLILAATSRRSVSSQHGRLGRIVVAEVAVTVLILGVTGFLAGASPVEADRVTDGPDTVEPPPGGGTVEVEQGDRVATVAVSPGTVGSNEIDVSVFNRVDRGELPDELAVEIAPADGSVGALEVAVQPISQSRVVAPAAQFTFPGTWNVIVRARYGEFESITFTAVVTITP
jgi:copper transport protein